MTTRLGYACINMTLKKDIMVNKTCRLATAIKQGEESGHEKGTEEYSKSIYDFVTKMSLENLYSMYKIIVWSKMNNILFYRVSSGMFPHINNERLKEHMTESDWANYTNLNFCREILIKIGRYVQKYNMRISAHPDHYVQLATKSDEVLRNSFSELIWHSKMFDIMMYGAESYIESMNWPEGMRNTIKIGSILCIHGGGTFSNKKESLERWKKAFWQLPESVRKRVCVENCEKSYCVEDLLPLCNELGIPLIFDFHHYACWAYYHKENPHQKSIEELLPLIFKTWGAKKKSGKIVFDKIPKFHLSDQNTEKKIGAHHDYVENIPQVLLDLMGKLDFDIMIEAKQKELAVIKLKEKYNLKN